MNGRCSYPSEDIGSLEFHFTKSSLFSGVRFLLAAWSLCPKWQCGRQKCESLVEIHHNSPSRSGLRAELSWPASFRRVQSDLIPSKKFRCVAGWLPRNFLRPTPTPDIIFRWHFTG